MPDHLDTHQHCLLFPQVRQIVIELAKSEGIRALRLPAPAEPPGDDPPTPLGDEVRLYRQQADDLRRALLESGLRHPQGLLGMPWLNRLDDAGLAQLLRNLPAGDWELMVHPGYPDPQNPFSGAQRLQELQALTNPAIRSLCAERAITLISFAEL